MAIKVIERRRSIRYAYVGGLPAPLLAADESVVACLCIDVSRVGLGVMAGVELSIGDHLKLAFAQSPVQLQITSKSAVPATKQWRYGMMPVDGNVDLQARLRAEGCAIGTEPSGSGRAPAAPHPAKTHKTVVDRAPRYGIDWELRVDATTLGMRYAYPLYVLNISRSGMLIASREKDEAPFLVNTLIDITIDPQKKHLPRPVHGFARVVRHLVEKDEATGRKKSSFGLVISEIFAEDEATWEGLMETLERDAEYAASPKT